MSGEPISDFEKEYGVWGADIRCPNCGHTERDSWECGIENGGGECEFEHECSSCETALRVERCYMVRYTTRLLTPSPKASADE